MPGDSAIYRITGGAPLRGRVRVSGSKNGADYAMAAALLSAEDVVLHNVPDIGDTRQMAEILVHLGARVERTAHDVLRINCADLRESNVPPHLAAQLRASFLVMGPLIARLGMASCPPPGGDAIGIRPLDVHLAGFRMLGATVAQSGDAFDVRPETTLRGAHVVLDYPSVMGTLNVMLAATLAEGRTTIINAACEPEIQDLAAMLNAMGARIAGAGTNRVQIDGVRELRGTEHRIIPDRVEAGTFALAAAITRGDVEIEEAVPDHLDALLWKIQEAGATVRPTDAGVRVSGAARYHAVAAQALPYPGLATDLQPQLAAFLTQAEGTSTIHERVYDNRLLYVGELAKMGANVLATGPTAIITGPVRLHAAAVRALDVRAGSACVLAALAAEGTTEISDVYHIERAHEDLRGKLRALGASIERA
ncbi:MAG TPA: UDP-N-acetylglucosamine 1-carboxyvinyltransferase [Dehalococcoidia bacterium]|nr:UDP-N-acetylglucosamine 1-carboxyvinyltransferase [Dehalococcoidia bacterium]